MAMCGISHWTLDCGGFFVVRDAYDRRGCDCAAEAPNPLWFWRGDYNDGVKDPAYILSATYGIVVRTGLQCAPLLCARIGAAQGVVRASPGPFTTAQEGDALLRAVREISGGLPRPSQRNSRPSNPARNPAGRLTITGSPHRWKGTTFQSCARWGSLPFFRTCASHFFACSRRSTRFAALPGATCRASALIAPVWTSWAGSRKRCAACKIQAAVSLDRGRRFLHQSMARNFFSTAEKFVFAGRQRGTERLALLCKESAVGLQHPLTVQLQRRRWNAAFGGSAGKNAKGFIAE